MQWGGYNSGVLWEGICPGAADVGTCATPGQRTWGQKKTWDAEAHDESGEARGSSFASARLRAGAQTYTHSETDIRTAREPSNFQLRAMLGEVCYARRKRL